MKKILVILGATATGKTDLAIRLGQKFNGQLISADSRQVYKNLDIGTGKYPNLKTKIKRLDNHWEANKVKIWMYDVVDFKTQYTVADYVKKAGRIMTEIHGMGDLPIVVGGTGLYIRALVDGLPDLGIPVNEELRKDLERLSKEQLQKKLQEISSDKWNSLNKSDRENPRRLIRAIELVLLKPLEDREIDKISFKDTDILKIGLTASKEVLYQRVDKSVIARINQGMIEEAENLHKNGLTIKRMKQLGLEYGVLADYIEGHIKDKDQLVNIMQRKVHSFVKHQITWFKKEKDVKWFDISKKDTINKVEELVSIWYDSSDANKD